jgi:hypothetical protein
MNGKTRLRVATIIEQLPRWRVRTWLILVWTATVAVISVEVLNSSSSPPGPCYSYGCFAPDMNFEGPIIVGLIVVVWPLGVGIICAAPAVGAAIKRRYRERFQTDIQLRNAELDSAGCRWSMPNARNGSGFVKSRTGATTPAGLDDVADSTHWRD